MVTIQPPASAAIARNVSATHGSAIAACDGLSLPLERAIVRTVAYADIFDYPLTAAELQRYLIGVTSSLVEVEQALGAGQLVPEQLTEQDGFFALPSRAAPAATRGARTARAEQLWPRARHYGRIIASLPFVRMVAITGELAMDNVQPDSDIDYFIVTTPGRLWLCRLFVVAVVRAAAPRGVVLCPNYLLSERALAFEERNLYSAHEVAQMVPLTGFTTYQRLRAANGWVAEFLPNADGPPRSHGAPPRFRLARHMTERALGGRLGDWLEGWEMRRKVRKLGRVAGDNREAAYSADWCKGHVNGHEQRILTTYTERWRAAEGRLP